LRVSSLLQFTFIRSAIGVNRGKSNDEFDLSGSMPYPAEHIVPLLVHDLNQLAGHRIRATTGEPLEVNF
jgi:hypothetical protein